MRILFVFIFSIIIIKSFSQELYFDDGLFLEKARYKDTTKHKYTLDNITYKLNSVFIYNYYYSDANGFKRKFLFNRIPNNDNPLALVPEESYRNDLIHEIRIEVSDDSRLYANDSDYTQTIICYRYLNKKGLTADTLWDISQFANPNFKVPCAENTGVIDNKKNIFLHPPRICTFRILEFSPFPLYYLDEKTKSWQWNVTIGGDYLDPRWINTQNKVHAHYKYKREPDEILLTAIGTLKYKVTSAVGTFDELELKTKLKSYFHPQYGFVRLEYSNINGSNLTFELIDKK